MTLATTLRGVDARLVRVTVQREHGLPTLLVKGLSVAAERESRVRVQAALANANHRVSERVTVSCDAGGVTIDGTGLDFAIALAAAGVGEEVAAIGELALSGQVRGIRGALAGVEALRAHGATMVLVAPENAAEAALDPDIRAIVVYTLEDALAFLAGDTSRGHQASGRAQQDSHPSSQPDMRDVRGHAGVLRAIEVAAVGVHNIAFVGGPGAGKTMLARRIPSILPPLSNAEALEVTRAHSAAGLNVGGGLATRRPFRAPHHSTTPSGLVGGGASLPRPGEVTLAHHGVLFLDELPEFTRSSLEVLAEPLATGEVHLARASGTLRYPARCLVAASLSPCPCGRFGSARCACSLESRARYLGRVPTHLLDQIDVRIHVPLVAGDIAALPPGESSAAIAARVAAARVRLARVEGELDADGRRAFSNMLREATLATYERVVRVARSIAALEGAARLTASHVTEAVELTRARLEDVT